MIPAMFKNIKHLENYLYDRLGVAEGIFSNLRCISPSPESIYNSATWKISYIGNDWEAAYIQWFYELGEGYSFTGKRIQGLLELVDYIKKTMRRQSQHATDNVDIASAIHDAASPIQENSALEAETPMQDIGKIAQVIDDAGILQYYYVIGTICN